MPDRTISQSSGAPVTKIIQVAGIFVGALGLFSGNALLTVASVLSLMLYIRMFWRPGEPPVLLFAMGYQWLQASILVFQANLTGLPLSAVDSSRGATEATWLSLFGLLFLALGTLIGVGPSRGGQSENSVSTLASRLSVSRLFTASLGAIGASAGLKELAASFPNIRQPILALGNLHWVLVYLLVFTALSQRRGYSKLAIVFGLELVIGFLGFFSDFKTILIIFFLAALAAPGSLRGMRLRTAFGVGALTIFLGLFWTGIKQDYREFLNQGTGQQVELIPIRNRIDKLIELSFELTPEKFYNSADKLINRLTYIHFFGECLETVPDILPYENGKLWREGIMNVLSPRLLFPSKGAIHDSVRTAYYTRQWVGSAEEGASISLGYVAESYIDFGPILMMAPLFLWGLFVGWTYRVLAYGTKYPLYGYASATVLISIGASVLEQSNAKMVGGMALGFLALFLIQKFFDFRILRFLVNPDPVHGRVTHI